MKLINLKFLAAFLFALCSNAYADWTSVICAKPDGSQWYWLKDSAGNQETASGVWLAALLQGSKNEFVETFSIGEHSYQTFSSQCKTSYVAQPAKSRFSSWAIFEVLMPDGTSYLAPGKFDTFRERNCYLSAVNCRLHNE